jgi:hypothetical protein
MSHAEIAMLVGGLLAIVLGAIDWVNSDYKSLTSLGVAILGIVFCLLALDV